jgi:hypothetical protein
LGAGGVAALAALEFSDEPNRVRDGGTVGLLRLDDAGVTRQQSSDEQRRASHVKSLRAEESGRMSIAIDRAA